MLTQEEMAQPFFNHEHFVQEEEKELVEPVELDKNEQPSPPSTDNLFILALHMSFCTTIMKHNNLSLFLKGID